MIFGFSLDARIRFVAFLAKRIVGCECSTRRTGLESNSPSGDDGFDNRPRRSGFRVTKNGNGPFDKDQGLLQGSPWLVKAVTPRPSDGGRFHPMVGRRPGSLSPTSALLTRTRRLRGRALCALGLVVAGIATSTAAGAIDFAPRLTVRTEPQPTGVLVLDVTGDHVPDIVTASSSSSQVLVHAGIGGGRFATGTGIVISDTALALAAGDFNEDGKVDLATANRDRTVSVLTLDGVGRVAASTTLLVGGGPTDITAGDVNGDGHLDLVVVNSESRNASVLLGHGPAGFDRGRFTNIGDFPVDALLADVTEDGRPDIVAAVQTPPGVSIVAGAGDGTFARPVRLPAGQSPTAVAVADLNRDGHLDILAANRLSYEVTVQLGVGEGRFVAGRPSVTSSLPSDLAVGDWTGDGLIDVATSNGGSDDVSVLAGDGRGNLGPARQFQVGKTPGAIVSADATGDGRPDVVTANGGGETLTILSPRPLVGRGTAKLRVPCPPQRRFAVSEIETRCVTLTMSQAQVTEILGRPKRARRLAGGAALRWHYRDLLVQFNRTNNFVTSLRTLQRGARTAEGVAVGEFVGDLSGRLDQDVAICSTTAAIQTCVVAAFFTAIEYHVVNGRVTWIELRLVPGLF